jgi:hypothetical protein
MAPTADAAWCSIMGRSTSHGLAMATNLTASRYSPRGSTINAGFGALRKDSCSAWFIDGMGLQKPLKTEKMIASCGSGIDFAL